MQLEEWVRRTALQTAEPEAVSRGEGALSTTSQAASFEEALAFVLQREGGYVNDPEDPGGATNMGITQRVYDTWRKAKGLPRQDVCLLRPEEAQAIYLERYWIPSGATDLPEPLAMVHFDTAVNMGVGRAREILSRVQKEGLADPQKMTLAYLDQRLSDYLRIMDRHPKAGPKGYPKRFLGGWLNRMRDLAWEATKDKAFVDAFTRRIEEGLEARAARDSWYAEFLTRWRRQWGR